MSEVCSIAGEWDLVTVLRAERNEDVADLVTSRALMTPGVEETETLNSNNFKAVMELPASGRAYPSQVRPVQLGLNRVVTIFTIRRSSPPIQS